MTWVAVAIAGAAVVGGAASYLGSKKQADASKNAANISQGQYQNNVQMQQPFVSSGYGALSKLNTLMGINPDPNAQVPVQSMNQTAAPNWMTMEGPKQMLTNAPNQNYTPTRQQITDPKPSTNPQLRQILQIRADNGDPQAKQMLSMLQ